MNRRLTRAIVYQITNLIDGNRYIGVTRFPVEVRWAQHRYKSQTKPRTWFHRAINKYGADNFKVEAIATCLDDWSAAEREVIRTHQPEYNMTNGGEITVGRRIPDEVKEKIRLSNIGKKRTPEQNAAMSALKKKQLEDPEYRARALAALEKGRKNTHGENWRVAMKKAGAEGKMSHKLTEERKAQQLANLNTPEARANNAASKRKMVECVSLNTVFDSLLEAAEFTGVNFGNISMVCLGKRKRAGGLIFRYI